jgi:phospholipid-binding lipoprotein MlaA
MKTLLSIIIIFAFLSICWVPESANAFSGESKILLAQQNQESSDAEDDEYEDDEYEDDEYEDEGPLISDPLYYFNKGMYHFNDKLYFWLLKPVARGYRAVLPIEIRTAIKNVIYNLRFPVRFINALLQGKGSKAVAEFNGFFLNTTMGLGGVGKITEQFPSLNPSREDLGQTFAVWGIDNGAFLMLPFLGPSSLRDALGRLGDTFTDPIWWAPVDFWTSVGIRAGEGVNDVSMRIGDYEALKEAAIDPYTSIKDAYVQNRNSLIEK